MADKKLHAEAGAVGCFGGAVAGADDGHEVEGLAGFLQGADDLRGAGGIDVGVEFSDDEEEIALQLVGVVFVGAAGVAFIDGPAHPLLVPPDFVHAVVVAAAVGDGDVVEVVMIEQGAHGVLAAGTAAVDADAGEVHPGACFGGGFDPELAVGKAGILEVFPADIVEGLAAMIGAHAVEFDDDEAEFGEDVVIEQAAEILGGEGAVRSGIDVFDDGVFFWRDRSGRA